MPDEHYLIVNSDRPGSHGDHDLHPSIRSPDGSWQPPHNLGNTINTPSHEYAAVVSPSSALTGTFSLREKDCSGLRGTCQ